MLECLIVESCRKIIPSIKKTLPKSYLNARSITKYEPVPKLCNKINPDLLIVGINSDSQTKGLHLIKTINKKQKERNTPKIIVLASKLTLKYKIKLFQAGIDDILYKPLEPVELTYRINNVLHLRDSYGDILLYQNDEIALNMQTSYLHIYNSKVNLTELEVKVIKLLFENNNFVRRSTLKYKLKTSQQSTITDNYLNVIIQRLRKKIKLISGSALIKTKYGKGYYINT